FIRLVTAADLGQGILGSLDERACRLPGMDPNLCEREAIMASVSEPIFVPSRPRVYSGLTGAGGEAGFWVDGGLERLDPASRAVAYTSGKVLAINTCRALGTPVSDVGGLTPIALGTIMTLGTRMIQWESAYAGLEQQRRRGRICEIARLVGVKSDQCPERG